MSTSETAYTPVQYDNPLNQGQDPETFYGVLIDPQTEEPSQLFCRMSDSWFFYLDRNCPENPTSGYIEPEKVIWQEVAVGGKRDLKTANVLDLGSLYLAASIPHSLNSGQEPVLDRRGFLHLLVFDARLDPEDAYKDWNRRLNVLKLIDPLTGLHFPTPVPRYAFPSEKNVHLNAAFEEWKKSAVARMQATEKQAQPQTQQSASTQERNFQQLQQALRDQERFVLRSQIMASGHRTRMNIINNMGGGSRYRHY